MLHQFFILHNTVSIYAFTKETITETKINFQIHKIVISIDEIRMAFLIYYILNILRVKTFSMKIGFMDRCVIEMNAEEKTNCFFLN